MLDLLTIAVWPRLGLLYCLMNWGRIDLGLRERPRKRQLQHEKVLKIIHVNAES